MEMIDDLVPYEEVALFEQIEPSEFVVDYSLPLLLHLCADEVVELALQKAQLNVSPCCMDLNLVLEILLHLFFFQHPFLVKCLVLVHALLTRLPFVYQTELGL